MLKHNRKKCTAPAVGTVVKVKRGGLERPTVIWVSYQAEGGEYTLHETMKLKSEWIRLGKFPIGQRKTAKLRNLEGGYADTGTRVRVLYNPDKPQMAYLPDNVGFMNV